MSEPLLSLSLSTHKRLLLLRGDVSRRRCGWRKRQTNGRRARRPKEEARIGHRHDRERVDGLLRHADACDGAVREGRVSVQKGSSTTTTQHPHYHGRQRREHPKHSQKHKHIDVQTK